jgi:tetratricopeptide (TPR) repeat protein
MATTSTSKRPGKAGHTDYDQWHKVTNELVDEVEKEEKEGTEHSKAALGLDGKYAHSKDDAEERGKAKDVKRVKKALDSYLKRENAINEGLRGLLGPPVDDDDVDNDKDKQEEKTDAGPKIVRVTRDMLDAGKRVVTISDTSGASLEDTIVLTSDLSLLESKMKANANQIVKPKEFPDDAENDVKEEEETEEERTILGVIKCFIRNVHNCTILLKCKFITGSVEMSHCTNVVLRVEKDATVATVQADLCDNITIEFRDAPSGKNTNLPGQKRIYWGEDKEDRIFHAGVKNMRIRVLRDGYVEYERLCDYETDGAKAFGNATGKEFQFATSVLEEELITESVVREGATTGENARAMTERELKASDERREKAAIYAQGMAENMIKFKEKGEEGIKVTKKEVEPVVPDKKEEEEEKVEEEIEEIYGSMSTDEIATIVKECEKNKARGNEAFGTGEYFQAILLYSLALDKADELPDASDPLPAEKQLFPRDVTLTNRAACFLKMGDHEKAEADAKKARDINPKNVKAIFRHGLAFHAMKRYQEAIPILAEAHKLEPKNRQIKEALQFAEVRMTQDMRKRMAG